MRNFFKLILLLIILTSFGGKKILAEESSHNLLKQDWSFNSFFGKFDRASLQRGFQVYTEVCASCHSKPCGNRALSSSCPLSTHTWGGHPTTTLT